MRHRERLKQYREWCETTRAAAYENARALAVNLAYGTPPDVPIYDLGIVLNPGERALHRCPATYVWRGTRRWMTYHEPLFGPAERREHTAIIPVNAGTLDWLITNQRLAARETDGTVVSIYWGAIRAVTVDLEADRLTLDGAASYHGELSGPAITPLSVAAVACCHGRQALLVHPALDTLRSHPNWRHEVQEVAIALPPPTVAR